MDDEKKPNVEPVTVDEKLNDMGLYSATDNERVRGNLLRYCKVDTLAMVRVHEVLVGMGQQ
jgi:hypothetical protein